MKTFDLNGPARLQVMMEQAEMRRPMHQDALAARGLSIKEGNVS
jgi:hypothetical protein